MAGKDRRPAWPVRQPSGLRRHEDAALLTGRGDGPEPLQDRGAVVARSGACLRGIAELPGGQRADARFQQRGRPTGGPGERS